MNKINFTLFPPQQSSLSCEGFFFANNLTQDYSGELVFTTSMGGYEQSITDLSYQGQALLFTFPEIGTYSIQQQLLQAKWCGPKLVIAKKFIDPDGELKKYFDQEGITAIEYSSTRSLTKLVRQHGSLEFKINLTNNPNLNYRSQPYCRLLNSIPFQIPANEKMLVIDFGIKESILHELQAQKIDYTIIDWQDFIKIGRKHKSKLLSQINGILLSNGPGNPADYAQMTPVILNFINLVPTFGICLGHQILAQSLGAKIKKLHFGHHGNNHPVYSHLDKKIFTTSQNHNYVVSAEDLPVNCQVSFTHANDKSIAGLKYGPRSFSVQFHPEGNPGPTDTFKFFQDIKIIIHEYSKEKATWSFDTHNFEKAYEKNTKKPSKTFCYWGQGPSLSARALNSIMPQSNA